MKLRIVTVSSRPPHWIQLGYDEYARRMPHEYSLELVEIKPETRGNGTLGDAATQRLKSSEAARIRTHLSGYGQVVALDERGKSYSTMELANQLKRWQGESMNAAFLIGGADGLDDELKGAANVRMSLSAMTLPHQLVRVILAEQLYRAASILNNHPYHRA